MNQQLIEYIQKARESGLADDQIEKSLLQAGWPEVDVKEGLNPAEAKGTPIEQGPVKTVNMSSMVGKTNKKLYFIVGAAVVLIVGIGLTLYFIDPFGDDEIVDTEGNVKQVNKNAQGIVIKDPLTGETVSGFVKFESEEEYKTYLSYLGESFGLSAARRIGSADDMFMEAAPLEMALPDINSSADPGRSSGTNVQVLGIDEPDIIKTDGKQIYVSRLQDRYYTRPVPMMESFDDIRAPEQPMSQTHVVKAFPLESLGQDSTIDKAGDLLLSDNTLVIFEQTSIYGYDVSDPKNPSQKWQVELDEENRLEQARLYDGKIYLVTRTMPGRDTPCIVPLFKVGEQEITVSCQDIYHPIVNLEGMSNYHVSALDPVAGAVTEGVSFVGSYDATVYMSKENMYIAYSYPKDFLEVYYGFIKENEDLFGPEIIAKMEKLESYDISMMSKMMEVELILEQYLYTLDEEEQDRIEDEMEARLEEYLSKNKRNFTKSDIVKINLQDFKLQAVSTIAGKLLNQFSMDEYEEHLRVATTVGNSSFGFFGSGDSENDIYILDKNLSVVGSIQGLGLEERIYAARFIQDKGYLVTFRQIDPFYVLDLSDPANPQRKGELKIPGYSSYLHPIDENTVLGIGKEESKVKISLFDVTDPANPVEADKYTLDEYWSEILNTHHAFLLDAKYQVFFIPGGRGGYIFSYADNKLVFKKEVTDIVAKRALYIDDYLYLVGDSKIVVLDEKTWDQAKQLDLTK